MKQVDPIFSLRNYSRIVSEIAKAPPVKVGDTETFEIQNAHFKILNPRDRLVLHPGRKLNFPFAAAEWLSLVSGVDDVSFFTQFISSYGRFSSDGIAIDGAYGPRLLNGFQIDGVISELKRDMHSRRAVMSIYDGKTDLNGGGGKNTPCTLSLQFMVRNSKLDMITNMRSNDVVLGLPYDVFQFTMLQEFVSVRLGIPLGTYYHNAGSLHFYADDSSKKSLFEKEKRWPHTMNAMPKDLTLSDVNACVMFMKLVDARLHVAQYLAEKARVLPQYLYNFVLASQAFVIRKEDFASALVSQIDDMTIRKVMRQWVR